MSLHAGLQAWLPVQGVSGPIIVGAIPQDVYEALIIYPTGGKAPDHQVGARFPTVQITALSLDFARAEDLAQQVYTLLSGTGPHLMGDQPVGRTYANQEPFHLGPDERQRHRWVCNYRSVI